MAALIIILGLYKCKGYFGLGLVWLLYLHASYTGLLALQKETINLCIPLLSVKFQNAYFSNCSLSDFIYIKNLLSYEALSNRLLYKRSCEMKMVVSLIIH